LMFHENCRGPDLNLLLFQHKLRFIWVPFSKLEYRGNPRVFEKELNVTCKNIGVAGLAVSALLF
jgi:hypothetical protein